MKLLHWIFFYSWINPEERTEVGGKKMRKTYTESQHDFFFLTPLYDEVLGTHSQHTTSAQQDQCLWDAPAANGGKGKTQHLWRPFHGMSASAGHCGQQGGAGADVCLGPNHPWWGWSDLQPPRNGDELSSWDWCQAFCRSTRIPACPAPSRKTCAVVQLYMGLGQLWWYLQRPETQEEVPETPEGLGQLFLNTA